MCSGINSKQFAKIIIISCLVATVSSAHFARGLHAASSQLSAQAIPAPSGQASADASAKAAAQQAKLHYVEIGPSLKGDYKFGYDTGSGPAGQSFREETRLDDGTVKGAYGYVDANGKQRIVRYTAGKNGFVVEGDQEAPGSGQAAPAQAAPAEAAPAPRRPQPVAVPQPQAAPAQPTFDEAAPAREVQALPTPEERARAEQQHAEQLRQHQLAQQAALAQQQQFAQRLQAQQQQQLAAEQQARSRAQVQHQPQQPQLAQSVGQHQHQHATQAQPQHQQAQPHFAAQPRVPAQHVQHQQIDPQSGSFFSSSNDPNLQQLLNNQLRQLQSGNQFVGQFQPPQAPVAPQQPSHFGAQPSPAFQQPAAQFAQPQPPQDFSQFRAARQAANEQQFQPQQHQPAGPRAALLALHQQQQHDAQMLANLRAQQLARIQEAQLANRQPAPQHVQQVPPQFDNVAPVQQQPRQQHFAQSAPQQQQHQHQHRALQQASAVAPVEAAAAQPQPEVFGPPVIDIRTLNYSIGQQMRV